MTTEQTTPSPLPTKVGKKKENSIITVTIDGTVLTLDILGAGRLTFDALKAHSANRFFAEMHGWKQRLSDAAAIPCDKATGKAATPEEKLEAIKARIEHYESGIEGWNMARSTGGGRKKAAPPTVEEIGAAMVAFGRVATLEAAILLLDKLAHKHGTSREGAAGMLAKDARYAADVMRQRAEKAGSSLNGDDLLDELEERGEEGEGE